MNKKISLGMAISLMAIAVTIAITLTYTIAINTFESRMSSITDRQATYDLITEIDGKVRQEYSGRISESALRQGVAAGYISGLRNDSCKFFSSEDWELENDRKAGYDFGLGIDISKAADGNIQINRVTAGSPAANAGLQKGDIITYVNGTTVLSTGYDKAVSTISTSNTEITLRVKRDGNNLRFTVTKASFNIVSVEYHVINDTVGYISINQFNSTTPDQFNSALSKLQRSGIKGLIIDLRDSAGGSFEDACNILDTILPAGKIMLVTDKTGATTTLYTSDTRSVDLPMSVLINGSTTGAAELFASAVYDYSKGSLVGTATAGEMTVQDEFELSDGSAVSITTGTWSTTAGLAVKDGVVNPDFEVKLTSYQQENRYLLSDDEDPQIQTALELLESAIEAIEAANPTEPEPQPNDTTETPSAPTSGSDAAVSGSDTAAE